MKAALSYYYQGGILHFNCRDGVANQGHTYTPNERIANEQPDTNEWWKDRQTMKSKSEKERKKERPVFRIFIEVVHWDANRSHWSSSRLDLIECNLFYSWLTLKRKISAQKWGLEMAEGGKNLLSVEKNCHSWARIFQVVNYILMWNERTVQ